MLGADIFDDLLGFNIPELQTAYLLLLPWPTSHETRQTNVIISFFGVFLIMHAWVYNWPTNQTFFCREL